MPANFEDHLKQFSKKDQISQNTHLLTFQIFVHMLDKCTLNTSHFRLRFTLNFKPKNNLTEGLGNCYQRHRINNFYWLFRKWFRLTEVKIHKLSKISVAELFIVHRLSRPSNEMFSQSFQTVGNPCQQSMGYVEEALKNQIDNSHPRAIEVKNKLWSPEKKSQQCHLQWTFQQKGSKLPCMHA